MAEVLGLAANVAAVLQLASQVAQLSYKYARDVKNAPRTQKQYLQEVSALMEVLFRVEEAVQDAESTDLLPNRPSALSADSVMDCYKALSDLYFDLQKRRPRFLQPFHEREWRDHIDILTKYRSLFTDFLSSCVLATGTATYNKVTFLNKEQDRSLLLTWLPAPNLPARRRPSPCPGTGGWFLEEDSVQKWIEKTLNFVWCYGAPGVGKSFLASRVIDHLLDARVSQDSLVISFFCDFTSPDEQNAIDILHHILRQIIEQGNAEILTILKESCKDPSKLQRTTEVAELIASAGLAKPMYLILDAVDELKDPIPLLSEIKPLVSAGINVLITSRDLPHIRKNMARARMLKVKSNPKDLKLYIESRLRDSDFSEEIDEGGRLVGDILSNSGNLFLLSRLTLDNVLDFTTINQIRKALRNHHASLHQAFKATIGRIESQSKARSSLAHRLLRWMTQAKRRLRLQEILCAFSVEDEELDPDNKPHPDILLRVCHGLVVVDDVDDTVGLVHTTAYEFLKSIKDLGQEGGLDIARTSLQYLTMKHTSNPCATSREMLRQLQSLEFFEYSAKYWGHHISMPDQERQLEGLITKLLSDDRKRNSAFQALQYQLEFAGSSSGEDVLQSMPKDLGALHVAAYWGLTHTARIFLAKGESVCGLDSHKWTPLHWACCQSHPDVVDLLIAVGADVNAQDIQGWTPLFWAAFNGDAQLVRLLLSHGANHLLRSTLGWTALHWAVSSGHSETVKIFLEHHARAETQEPVLSKMSIQSVVAYAEGILPVQVAAEGQDLEIFNLLVQHLETPGGVIGDAKFNMIWATAKFDSPASNNPWRTLTKGDKVNGRESTLPRLTGSYADKSEQYRTDPTEWKTVLLVSAVRDGQLSSVQLLAKAGANVNSALYAAACRRDPIYVRCLLEHGADPNKPSYGHFALHEAVLNGFLETTAALIDGGADANNAVPPGNSDGRFGRRRRYGRGPTMRAAHRLLTRIIPLGKNVHYALVQFAGATPLIQACGFLFGSKSPDLSLEMALLLLSYGADPGLKDASGMTALHYAAMRPHLPLIKLLVSSGCPVDVRDEKGRLPIHCLGNITGSLSDKTREYQIDTSHMPEVIRIILDVAHCSAFPHMLEVPVHRGPTAVDDDRTVQSGQEVEGLTPMGIALATKQWEIVVIFHALGAQIPHNMDLGPIVAAAIADLAVDAVGILLDNGAHIATDAIHTLLGALLARRSDGEAVDDALYPRFKRLLGTIVAAGAEVDSQSADGDTALVVAARIPGNVNVIKDLANIGADVFAFSGLSFDPILTAAVYGDIECLSYLLDQAAAHPNENHWSNFSGELGEIILDPLTRLCLYLKSADDLNRTNKQGRTLLHLATERGNVPLIRSLLACGAQPDITDERGWYAVHDAGAILNAAAVQALLPRDTSTEETDIQTDRDKSFWLEIVAQPIEYPECYRNPLNIFQLAIIRGNIQIAQYLLEYGVYPNTCLSEFYDNEPVLYHAAKSGRCELVQLLLAHGASIETTDTFGWSPLHAACYFGHADIAKVLIEAGSDVHAETAKWNNNNVKPSGLYSGDNYRSQPLHLATMAGNADIVKILLDNGVDIYAQTECKDSWCRNSHGPTALHLALDTATFYGRNGEPLDEGRLRIAEWMVERGLTVQGVIPRFGLEQILMFKAFPDLWDALRAGEMEAGE